MIREVLLRIENAHVHYGGVKALSGASVVLDEGEIVALMGPNGAGKSTILKTMFGLANLSEGKILWHEKSIHPVPHEMVEEGIAFVPQGRRVFRHLSVRENLEVGGFIVRSKKLLEERIHEVLELFPALKPKLKAKSGTLSGGQQQMLAIGRGLMQDPQLLLLDEPSLGLAPNTMREIFQKIIDIKNEGTAILMVEQNAKAACAIADHIIVLEEGKVALEGGKEIMKSEKLKHIYLGGHGHS